MKKDLVQRNPTGRFKNIQLKTEKTALIEVLVICLSGLQCQKKTKKNQYRTLQKLTAADCYRDRGNAIFVISGQSVSGARNLNLVILNDYLSRCKKVG